MDITSILGLLFGIAILLLEVKVPNLVHFWSLNGFLIVFGGTIFALMASCSPKFFLIMLRHWKVLLRARYHVEPLIDALYSLSEKARKNGVLTLEKEVQSIGEPFFRKGMFLIIDAVGVEKVKHILEKDIECMEQRHEDSAEIYDKGASYATAFGMIGTLVKLVPLLLKLGEYQGNVEILGTEMALAFLPILYGSIFAYLIFNPIGRKLRVKNEEEVLYKQVVVEGVMAIQEGENPKYIKERLLSYIEEGKRDKTFSSGKKKR